MAVEQGGDFGVFKGFVGHDMTPVAGGIANGEQDRATLTAGQLKSIRAPFVPFHRVFGMLQQVGAAGKDQAIEAFATVGRQTALVNRYQSSQMGSTVMYRF